MIEEPVTRPEDDDDEAFLFTVRRRWRASRSHFDTWRRDAKEDYDFVAGNQWTDEDKGALEEQLRPVVTFNRLAPTIDAIHGMEVTNRQEVRFIPREVGDAGVNELLTSAADYVRDQCDAEDEESDAFMDMVTCGMGWTETSLCMEDNLDGEVKVQRADPMEMSPDPMAKKRNLSDGRYVFRHRDYARADFEEKWPDADVYATEDWDWGLDMPDDPIDGTQEFRYEGRNSDKVAGREAGYVRVLEYQWIDKEPVFRVKSRVDGTIIDLDQKRFGVYRLQMRKEGIQLEKSVDYIQQTRKVTRRAFIAGSTILERGNAPIKKGFTYKCITGKRDRNRNTWYGLVRAMKDPQRWANKFFSQILHIINSNAKGGLLIEEGAVEDRRKLEEDWTKADSVIEVAPGALSQGKIQEKGIAEYPASIERLMQFSMSSIRDVTGVNLELLGMADRSQPGILEHQRKQAGMTLLAGMFDSFRRYRKEQGRTLLEFIQRYISDGRLIRISGSDGLRYVPLARGHDVVEYDVIVDEAPTSPNQKERTWGIIQQMLPMLMDLPAAEQIILEVAKYSPLPEGMVQNIVRALQNAEADPEDVQEYEFQKAATAAGIDVARSEAEHNRAQARKAITESGTERLNAGTERLKVMTGAFGGVG